ncbi:hypothetical protein PS685_04968 [Pseudomonas fluorescens]|uniref:Uncharacterized protein n=1 Tax=Pseudomonas fluorescens TaxID=294 RepID=A0A5E6ZAS9_PSEFL|nr:hypothetical protein PS685_04390 [Pseudomonas fluorescens]VVN69897.1 hypothetical protein PS685_04968 [Pseudomonas fluorescens]
MRLMFGSFKARLTHEPQWRRGAKRTQSGWLSKWIRVIGSGKSASKAGVRW